MFKRADGTISSREFPTKDAMIAYIRDNNPIAVAPVIAQIKRTPTPIKRTTSVVAPRTSTASSSAATAAAKAAAQAQAAAAAKAAAAAAAAKAAAATPAPKVNTTTTVS